MKNLILIARVVFGVWMLANGVNHFFYHLYPEPTGHEPLAVQLMAAFVHSRLFDVAMAMELVCGALVLAGVIVPAALCVVTPVNVCAAFWALILDHNPTYSLLAVGALALNGLLMLAYIDYYKDMLQRNALSFGETEGGGMTWNQAFAWSTGRTSRMDYVKALIPLVLAAAFYTFLAKTGRNGEWVLATLLYPGFVLVAGRLHDMGQTGWFLAAPAALVIAALGLHFFGDPKAVITVDIGIAAYGVCIAFLVWGLIGNGQTASNRFGAPATA